MKVFEQFESQVRSYSRAFPVVFARSSGDFLYDTEGKRYIDFFCGAGALNYGHNNPSMKRALIAYLEADGVTHGLDMATDAKARFLQRFAATILDSRRLSYKMQFTGPTGTNAVEAALKLARKVTRRSNVIAFTNAYHGLSSGALSATANSSYRDEAYINRSNVSFMPFDGYLGENVDTMQYLARVLADKSSGIDRPAAVIVETIQAEGGINVARKRWLQDLDKLCKEYEILLIVDDIQVGCGRTGTFFSFEHAGIRPDIVVLSKSISGYGLPMSILLLNPKIDQWNPGEHSGTFRGNNLAFVTAAEALAYWENPGFADDVQSKSKLLKKGLEKIAGQYSDLKMAVRGTGMVYGLEIQSPDIVGAVSRQCFKNGLVIETCGAGDKVLKFLPALTVDENVLAEGLDIVSRSIESVVSVAMLR